MTGAVLRGHSLSGPSLHLRVSTSSNFVPWLPHLPHSSYHPEWECECMCGCGVWRQGGGEEGDGREWEGVCSFAMWAKQLFLFQSLGEIPGTRPLISLCPQVNSGIGSQIIILLFKPSLLVPAPSK